MLTLRRRAPRDPVTEQLRDIARQGTATARVAHAFAFLLIVLFSLASLVALAGDALRHFITAWQAGVLDIPSGISVAISTLLVPAMDFGMVYAASILRLLRARHAQGGEQALHWFVIAIVVITEASTYIYMASVYERPTTGPEWAIIVLRGLTAPFLAIYLSMARPLPVTARDILAQSELAAGAGVIRDVTTIANNHAAPLADKMMLYDASAVMNPRDRDRLAKMIAVAQIVANRATEPLEDAHEDAAENEAFAPDDVTTHADRTNASPAAPDDAPEQAEEEPEPPENDPNPPRGKRAVRQDSTGRDANRTNVRRVSGNSRQTAAAAGRTNAPREKTPRSDVGMSEQERDVLRERRIAAAKAILKTDPTISVDVLARRIAMATQHSISRNSAHMIMVELQGRKQRSRTAAAAEAAAREAAEAKEANSQ